MSSGISLEPCYYLPGCCWPVLPHRTLRFLGIRIGPPPQPRVIRVQPRSPGADYVWLDGYWYQGRHYKWHASYWTRPPYEGAHWVGPHHDGQQYYAGYWDGGHGKSTMTTIGTRAMIGTAIGTTKTITRE